MGDEFQYQPSVGKSGPKGQPDDRSEWAAKQSAAAWEKAVRESPLQRLRYYDALLARAGFSSDPAERGRVKDRVAQLIREVGAISVLSDPDVVSMVRELFGEKGVQRLKERANSSTDNAQPDVVANMADPLHQRGKK
jgi:hypothetical protein